MARRTMTIRRIDPWSVMKVGFLANLVLLGILLLAGRVVWFFIERLELVTKACEVAGSVGFQDCGLNGGNIFRNAMLLGLLGVLVQTGILVFVAFLFNLISELTGGLTIGVDDDLPAGARPVTAPVGRSEGRAARAAEATKTTPPAASPTPPRPAPTPDEVAREAAAARAQAARTQTDTAIGTSPRPSSPQPQPSPAPPTGQPPSSPSLPPQELFRRPESPQQGPQGPFRS